MSEHENPLELALRHHDRAAAGPTALWIGAEPTFTDRTSEAPEWLCEALGPDKEQRARHMLLRLKAANQGAVVLRPVGRQYAGEPTPRWCYGLLARRDGQPLWSGPSDMLSDGAPCKAMLALAQTFAATLQQVLAECDCFAQLLPSSRSSSPRLLCRDDSRSVVCDPARDSRLARRSVHEGAIVGAGISDELAPEGSYLIWVHAGAGDADTNQLWLELPGFDSVPVYSKFLERLATAAQRCGVGSLGLRGFPPPIDDSLAWTTLTPDPAVLEVNQAPQPDLESFHRQSQQLFSLARDVGLSPYRLQYNGAVSDSGGGGQLTIGGATPEQSPFFVSPELLPRLIRYVTRHPSLSYWFATQYVGACGQSPRADEGTREAFLELEVALEQLSLLETVSPEILYNTLRHFLADASGNPHRSELNIEKLHNPYLPGRGMLGLVEFRALSMAPSLTMSTARAMLFRALVAMLRTCDVVPTLKQWGAELHDRFALPFYLQQDLGEVFGDLNQRGFGLGSMLEELLLDREARVVGTAELVGCRLTLLEAIEFWPLVGDVASQEGGGSRLVDASTGRIEVRLDSDPDHAEQLSELKVSANGYLLPLCTVVGGASHTRVLALRYRNFVPHNGLHPTMNAESSITVCVQHPTAGALRVTLHSWRPGGEAYPGLPADLDDARERRRERVVVEALAPAALPPPLTPPEAAVSPYCLDLRRLPRAGS